MVVNGLWRSMLGLGRCLGLSMDGGVPTPRGGGGRLIRALELSSPDRELEAEGLRRKEKRSKRDPGVSAALPGSPSSFLPELMRSLGPLSGSDVLGRKSGRKDGPFSKV